MEEATMIGAGSCAYMLMYSGILYYQLVVREKETGWFQLYIPANIVVFISWILIRLIK